MKKEVKEVLEKIEEKGYAAYLVGGYPRDVFLNKSPDDYDICTNAPLSVLQELFGDISTPSFGSVKITYQNLFMEITLFRKEEGYYETRSPIISYTDSLQEDLKRRDFTINTLCMDKEENFLDLLGAKEDIVKKLIRSVGDPYQKLKEDPLRILRAIRFATTLDFHLEEQLSLAIRKNKSLVSKLSYTRKKEELDKILLSPNCLKGIALLQSFELDKILECDFHIIQKVSSYEGMWAQISYSSKYPFRREERKKIETIQSLLKCSNFDEEMLYHYGFELCQIVFQIRGFDEQKLVDFKHRMPIQTRKDILITAKELMALGYPVRESYELLEHKILRGELPNSHLEILKYLKAYFTEKKIG